MTEKEFEKFIKDSKIKHYTSGQYVEDGFFNVPQGWYQIIADLITDLIELGWNKEIQQVKIKFYWLCFYIEQTDEKFRKRITEANNKALVTCEITGKVGERREGTHKILCDEEYFKLKNK